MGHLRGVAGNAVAAEQDHFVGQLAPVGQRHAAFGGGDNFDRVMERIPRAGQLGLKFLQAACRASFAAKTLGDW